MDDPRYVVIATALTTSTVEVEEWGRVAARWGLAYLIERDGVLVKITVLAPSGILPEDEPGTIH